jgi:hypothetical protein
LKTTILSTGAWASARPSPTISRHIACAGPERDARGHRDDGRDDQQQGWRSEARRGGATAGILRIHGGRVQRQQRAASVRVERQVAGRGQRLGENARRRRSSRRCRRTARGAPGGARSRGRRRHPRRLPRRRLLAATPADHGERPQAGARQRGQRPARAACRRWPAGRRRRRPPARRGPGTARAGPAPS